jgi:hypothetical protein
MSFENEEATAYFITGYRCINSYDIFVMNKIYNSVKRLLKVGVKPE